MIKKKKLIPYDPEIEVPIIHQSICTGEMVFGFKNLENNSFRELKLIQSEKDIEDLKKRLNVREIKKEY